MEFLKQNEGQAWILFKNGDNKMFTAIYSAYSQKLYQYGLKFTQNRSIIEDSIQDLFLDLWKNRRTIGLTDNILRYLFKSFRHKLVRRLQQEKRYDLNNDPEAFSFDVTYSFEQVLILREIAEREMKIFRTVLDGLTPRQKEAIYLKFTNGLSYEEVSGIMEMSLEACRNLVYRAVKGLREAITAGTGPDYPEKRHQR